MADKTNNSAEASGVGPGPGSLSRVGVAVAVVAVAGWLAFSVVLLFVADGSSDVTWTRMAWVFGSVQAIAFSAAGALFGTSIQAGRVAQAEDSAKKATQKAELHADDAMKGRAIAAMLQAEDIASTDEGPVAMGMGMGQDSGNGLTNADALRARHAQVSRSLFGNLRG